MGSVLGVEGDARKGGSELKTWPERGDAQGGGSGLKTWPERGDAQGSGSELKNKRLRAPPLRV